MAITPTAERAIRSQVTSVFESHGPGADDRHCKCYGYYYGSAMRDHLVDVVIQAIRASGVTVSEATG